MAHDQQSAARSDLHAQVTVLDVVPAHIALLDATGVIVWVNEAWKSFALANGSRLLDHGVGLNYLAICQSTDGVEKPGADTAARNIRLVLAGQPAQGQFEYPCHAPHEQRWFSIAISALPGLMTGRLSGGAVVMHVDVTARKLAELARVQASTLLKAVTDFSSDLLYVKDIGGRCLLGNAALARFVGCTTDELIGRKIPTSSDGAVLSSGQPQTAEYSLTAAGGTRTFKANKAPYRDPGGEIIGLIGISRDITDQRRAEDALRELNAELEDRVQIRTADLRTARKQAEQANQAKSEFLAAMSHEIRTPMNGVIGMIEVLHQTSLKGYQVEMANLIRDSAFSLLRIIDDILDMSKVEAGKLTIESEPFNLAGAVEKVGGMLDHVASRKDVEITFFLDPGLPRIVRGDEIRLRQILVNLIGNAIKFSAGRTAPGRVALRVLLVERSAEEAVIEMRVSDNGVGMDEATQGRLFRPFTQADASTTRRFGGTGLGLAISALLVKLMGGTLSVVSALDQGATFTVKLRLALVTGADALPAGASLVQGLHCRVIGIEQPMAADVTAYLQAAGAAVERFAGVDDAIAADRAPASQIWLILPDQPLSAFTRLRKRLPAQDAIDTRFVVLSHGKRRHPRVAASGEVTLDSNAFLHSSLISAVALAAGRLQEDDLGDHHQTPGVRTRTPGRQAARLQGKLILVVEDNETNRKVICQQLRLIGYAADIAVNGRLGLERWRSGDYGLVLTDVHMPEMDGHSLAAAIRQEEPKGRRTPIIALTANVLRNEDKRCRESGMDGYLSKPVSLQELRSTIESWLGASAPIEQVQTSAVATAPTLGDTSASTLTNVVDLDALVALIGDDPEGIADTLAIFERSAALVSEALGRAVQDGSVSAAREAAHKLKSGARSIGAMRLGEVCARIEELADGGDSELIAASMPTYRSEIAAVLRFLEARRSAVPEPI